MGASKGELKPKVTIKDIDVDKIPMENVTNRELYLIELMTKKKQITDKYVSDGTKPSDEENMMMTRLNIEITEQMQKIFHSKKRKKKPKKKIVLDPLLPVYKYSKLKNDFKILTWQWEELNGEHEEFKIFANEKQKADTLRKDRGLFRKDPFYPDSDEEEEEEKGDGNINNNFLNFYNQNQGEDDEEEEEEDEEE